MPSSPSITFVRRLLREVRTAAQALARARGLNFRRRIEQLVDERVHAALASGATTEQVAEALGSRDEDEVRQRDRRARADMNGQP